MARNSEQNERMREERKAQIRREALNQFSEKGLYATKIQDIAKGVGMAQGLVYHYYSSKEELYGELIHEALDKLNEAALALKERPESSGEKIRLSLIEMLRVIETSESFAQTCRLIAQAANGEGIPASEKEIFAQKREIPYQIFAELMAEGQKEGTIVEGDPMELSTAFWTAINGLAIYKATRVGAVVLPKKEIYFPMFFKKTE